MKKTTILGLSKNEKRHIYKLKKEKIVLENITKLPINLGFNDTDYQIQYAFISEGDYKNKMVKRFDKIENLTDSLTGFQNKNYNIEVFIGNKKVFLVIKSNKQNLKKSPLNLIKLTKFINEK